MKDLVDLLAGIEAQAAAFYRAAAENFKENNELASALEQLAREEDGHQEVMDIVASCISQGHGAPASLTMDPSAQTAVKIALTTCTEKAKAGSLSAEDLAEAIVAIEFSEWNSLFFYVVNSLKDVNRDCKMAAIRIQGHIMRIQQFLEQLPLAKDIRDKIRSLPPLWYEKILVIEDDEAIRGLLQAVLRENGIVEVASNGEEGLEKIGQRYYSVIISDIRMPKMDGVQLFQKAHQRYPSISKRFVFFSGGMHNEQIDFLKQQQVRFIEKPMRIKQIKDMVCSILSSQMQSLN